MNVKIVYDNQAEEGFQSGWGFSALIDDSTLFDTGENEVTLLVNLQALGIGISGIQRVVLSHEDWDHVGGIAILKYCAPVTVYVPSAFSETTKDKISSLNPGGELVEIRDAVEIKPNLIVTPQLGTLKKEISLAVRSGEGIVLIVGCSHPGLDEIMRRASEQGPIQAVIGGFHGFTRLEALTNVSLIVPTHCTQKKQEILEMYPEKTRFVSAGAEIIIDPDSLESVSGLV